MSVRSRLAWVGAAACLFAARPSIAQVAMVPELPERGMVTPQARTEAIEAYGEARRQYQAGDLDSSLLAADSAFKAVPNSSTALIRATVLGKMKHPEQAFAALLVGADLGPTDAEQVAIEDAMVRFGPMCRPAMGWARVTAAPAGAMVEVDGARFLAPRTIGLSPGEHRVTVRALGYVTVEGDVRVRSGRLAAAHFALKAEPVKADLEPAPLPVPESVPVPVAPPARGPSSTSAEKPSMAPLPPVAWAAPGPPLWRRAVPWTMVGSGVAMVAAAVGLHVWAVDAAKSTDRYGQPISGMADEERRRRFDAANSDMILRGRAAFAMYGIGGALAVGGAVWLIVDHVRPMPVGVSVTLDRGTLAVSAGGRF